MCLRTGSLAPKKPNRVSLDAEDNLACCLGSLPQNVGHVIRRRLEKSIREVEHDHYTGFHVISVYGLRVSINKVGRKVYVASFPEKNSYQFREGMKSQQPSHNQILYTPIAISIWRSLNLISQMYYNLLVKKHAQEFSHFVIENSWNIDSSRPQEFFEEEKSSTNATFVAYPVLVVCSVNSFFDFSKCYKFFYSVFF